MIARNSTAAPVVEEITDPVELAKSKLQDEQFRRNWDWFVARAAQIYESNRGKCICVAGQQLFAADTPSEALSLAIHAFPDDNGRFTRIIPPDKMERIYAYQR